MRKLVFYIDTMYQGGAQRVMANLIDYFYQKNYEVVLINDFIQNGNKIQYPLPEGVKRVYLRKSLDGNKIVKNILRVIKLRNIISEERPDIVVSFLGRPNKRMLLATMGLNVKKIVSVRNDPKMEYGRSFLNRWVINRLFATADGCVFQTKEAKQYFSKKIQKKSTIILNPVAEKFYLVDRKKIQRDIITVGRLEIQKNQKLLIDAFAILAQKYPKENLMIYGEGALHQELEEYIRDRKLEKRVFLKGNISDMENVLSGAKLFVLSSKYEGLPNALMEAMAVGVPCISTNCPCGGPRELIQNENEGILVPCDDIESMRNAIDLLLSTKEKCETMTQEEKRRSLEFRAEVVYKQWENYFQNL